MRLGYRAVMEPLTDQEKSSATVTVVSAIALPGLDTFLIVADIESGAVRPGMELEVPIGSSAKRRLKIHGVGPALQPSGRRVGIAFEAASWEKLGGMGDRAMADGTTLEVSDPAV